MNQFLYDTCRTVKRLALCFARGWSPKAALCCDIDFDSLPASTHLPHPVGIVVGSGVIMGENCMVLQNVTIGRKDVYDPAVGKIIIGDCVTIYAGATILGPVNIGSNSIIAAGAMVTHDVPKCTVVKGVW